MDNNLAELGDMLKSLTWREMLILSGDLSDLLTDAINKQGIDLDKYVVGEFLLAVATDLSKLSTTPKD